MRVRRERTKETLPEKRVRPAPRAVIPEGQISVMLVVTATITRGSVSEKELADWMHSAAEHYCRWRNGWVGLGATGGIDIPRVTLIEDS